MTYPRRTGLPALRRPDRASRTRSPFTSWAHQRICGRHRIWPGRAAQIDLTAVPELISAHQHASRLADRYGITGLVLTEVTAHQCPHSSRPAGMSGQSRPSTGCSRGIYVL